MTAVQLICLTASFLFGFVPLLFFVIYMLSFVFMARQARRDFARDVYRMKSRGLRRGF